MKPMYYAFQRSDGTICFYAEAVIKNPMFVDLTKDLGKRIGDPLTRDEVVALTKIIGVDANDSEQCNVG